MKTTGYLSKGTEHIPGPRTRVRRSIVISGGGRETLQRLSLDVLAGVYDYVSLLHETNPAVTSAHPSSLQGRRCLRGRA